MAKSSAYQLSVRVQALFAFSCLSACWALRPLEGDGVLVPRDSPYLDSGDVTSGRAMPFSLTPGDGDSWPYSKEEQQQLQLSASVAGDEDSEKATWLTVDEELSVAGMDTEAKDDEAVVLEEPVPSIVSSEGGESDPRSEEKESAASQASRVLLPSRTWTDRAWVQKVEESRSAGVDDNLAEPESELPGLLRPFRGLSGADEGALPTGRASASRHQTRALASTLLDFAKALLALPRGKHSVQGTERESSSVFSRVLLRTVTKVYVLRRWVLTSKEELSRNFHSVMESPSLDSLRPLSGSVSVEATVSAGDYPASTAGEVDGESTAASSALVGSMAATAVESLETAVRGVGASLAEQEGVRFAEEQEGSAGDAMSELEQKSVEAYDAASSALRFAFESLNTGGVSLGSGNDLSQGVADVMPSHAASETTGSGRGLLQGLSKPASQLGSSSLAHSSGEGVSDREAGQEEEEQQVTSPSFTVWDTSTGELVYADSAAGSSVALASSQLQHLREEGEEEEEQEQQQQQQRGSALLRDFSFLNDEQADLALDGTPLGRADATPRRAAAATTTAETDVGVVSAADAQEAAVSVVSNVGVQSSGGINLDDRNLVLMAMAGSEGNAIDEAADAKSSLSVMATDSGNAGVEDLMAAEDALFDAPTDTSDGSDMTDEIAAGTALAEAAAAVAAGTSAHAEAAEAAEAAAAAAEAIAAADEQEEDEVVILARDTLDESYTATSRVDESDGNAYNPDGIVRESKGLDPLAMSLSSSPSTAGNFAAASEEDGAVTSPTEGMMQAEPQHIQTVRVNRQTAVL